MYIFLLALMAIIILIVALKFISSTISIFAGSPSGESPQNLIKKTFSQIKIKKTDTIYDLGSGYGNVIVTIAKNFQPQQIIGFEVSPLPFIVSKLRTFGRKNIQVNYQNILKVDLTRADIIFCYLWPTLLEKLATKFSKELKQNTVVISLTFKIKGLKEDQIIKINNKKIYLYRF